jgi:hypothetical protein
MKKLLAFFAVAFIAAAGLFAFDLNGIEGTWQDENYKANWTFNAGGSVTLKDSTGAVVYTFTDDNVSDIKPVANDQGVGVAFYCKETQRAYTFIKPIKLSADLLMSIDRDWTVEDYDVTIKFQK